ncbi:MAG: type IX secretion system membrane protein PorP/SprF [Crocinitomicaceae bacterium]
MSNPSFSNIDLWLFELNEGNLTPTQVEQLKLFLLQHPELDVDKDVWENARIQSNEYIYTKKSGLIRGNPIFRVMDFASVAVVLFAIVTIGFISVDNSSESFAKAESTVAQESKFQGAKTKTKIERSTFKSARVASNSASSSNLTNAFSNSLNALAQNSIQNHDNSNNSITQVTGIIVSPIANNLSINEIKNSGASNIESEPSNSQLVVFSASSIKSNPYRYGLIKDVEALDENMKDFASHAFYEMNRMKLKRPENVLGRKDHALMEINKDHELNFFQKKKKTLTKYQLMMKLRAGSIGRKVKNMLDNTVALQNFRDPHYNIPGMSVSDINFSSTGTQLATRIQTMSRLQWYGSENQQLMNQLNLDGYVYAMRGGFGLQMNHAMYKNGGVSIADIAVTYAPKISLSNTVSFEPSFRFKTGNKNLNHSKMNGANQLEIERGVVEDYYADGTTPIGRNLWYKDFGVGAMVNTKWFFAGLQIDNLARHKDNMYSNISDQKSYHQIIASAGTDWVSRNKNFSLSPYVVYQNEGKLSEMWVGANARLKWFVIGASYSSTRNPSATIGVKLKHVAVYYHADYSESKMTGDRNLSHQLTLKFVGKQSRFGKGG